MSIVRVGLAETNHFAEGYDAIFGRGSSQAAKAKPKKAGTKKATKPASKGKKKAKR